MLLKEMPRNALVREMQINDEPAERPPIPRRIRRSGVWRAWTVAWTGATCIGIGNAFLREGAFGRLSELRAHQLSTATLLAFLTWYVWRVERKHRLPSTRAGLLIGAEWAALTILFEFALGLLVTGDSLADLLENYNFAAGRVWALVPLWMVVAPATARRAHLARARHSR